MRRAPALLLFASLLAAPAAHPALGVAAPRAEEGLASFYGSGFEGDETASGTTFRSRALTAAHPGYPGGTVLKVTNLENSRSVLVRVTDRGPNRHARRKGVIIDLSREAARRLQFAHHGKARVRVEVVKMGK